LISSEAIAASRRVADRRGPLAGVAELERALIRERVTLGFRRAKERGTRTGKAIERPRVVDASQGVLTVDAVEECAAAC
jgi:DNA invertase Pin-like site-specific DNA recombinase